jgi:hypothetical protein
MVAPIDAPPARNAAEAMIVFRAAVERHGRDGSGLEHLRTPLLKFCAHARHERMAPEQVVIRVKHALDGFPVYTIDNPHTRQEMRARLISFAITTYYSEAE